MARTENAGSKRSISSLFSSLLQSAPESVMAPRLMVLIPVVALVGLGIVMVFSASSITMLIEDGDAFGEGFKQCAFAVVGLLASLFAWRLGRQNRWFDAAGLVFWILCLIGLVLTFFVGTAALGAKRWIIVGPVSIQVAEFAKIACLLMFARVLSDYNDGVIDLRQAILLTVLFLGVPSAIILIAQSDMGTTLIIAAGAIGMWWASGASTRTVLITIAAGIVLVAIFALLQPYRVARLMSFMDPWGTVETTGYQLTRSLKALSAGGIFGVGVANSYEKLQYLPEAETDFIFAIVGEELGLIGATVVILLFLALLFGSFRVASQANSPFNGLLCMGLGIMIVFQAFLNIACVVGAAPVTGKPLPFLSSGGSSLISSLMLIGFIMGVSSASHDETPYRERRDKLNVVSRYADGERVVAQERIPRAPRRGERLAQGAVSVRSSQPSTLRVMKGGTAYHRGSGVRTARATRR